MASAGDSGIPAASPSAVPRLVKGAYLPAVAVLLAAAGGVAALSFTRQLGVPGAATGLALLALLAWALRGWRRAQEERERAAAALSAEAARRRAAEEALADSERTRRRLLENLTEGYYFFRHDRAGHFTYVSPTVARVLGYEAAQVRSHFRDLLTDNPINEEARRRTALALAGERQPTYEIEVRAQDGTPRSLEVTEYPVLDAGGEVEFMEGIARDVTEQRRLQARLAELAIRDELTGLINRRHFHERLEEAIAASRRHVHSLSLAMVDLDGLKAVNDTHGHAAGDRLLQAAAEVLQRELRRGDLVGRLTSVAGRLGGDEFAALMPFATAEQSRVALERVLAAFAHRRVTVARGATVILAASAGVAELAPGMGLKELTERADRALYLAKRGGRGRICVWEEPPLGRVG